MHTSTPADCKCPVCVRVGRAHNVALIVSRSVLRDDARCVCPSGQYGRARADLFVCEPNRTVPCISHRLHWTGRAVVSALRFVLSCGPSLSSASSLPFRRTAHAWRIGHVRGRTTHARMHTRTHSSLPISAVMCSPSHVRCALCIRVQIIEHDLQLRGWQVPGIPVLCFPGSIEKYSSFSHYVWTRSTNYNLT